MVKLATFSSLFVLAAALSWTGYKAANAQASSAPQSATQSAAPSATSSADPLSSEAAYRHRNCLPRHWRGYILNQNGF